MDRCSASVSPLSTPSIQRPEALPFVNKLPVTDMNALQVRPTSTLYVPVIEAVSAGRVRRFERISAWARTAG
jgi:hypothetical protein